MINYIVMEWINAELRPEMFFSFLCCLSPTRHIAIIKRQGGLTGTMKAVPAEDENEPERSANCFLEKSLSVAEQRENLINVQIKT
jgi:hypothetical protein